MDALNQCIMGADEYKFVPKGSTNSTGNSTNSTGNSTIPGGNPTSPAGSTTGTAALPTSPTGNDTLGNASLGNGSVCELFKVNSRIIFGTRLACDPAYIVGRITLVKLGLGGIMLGWKSSPTSSDLGQPNIIPPKPNL